MEFDRFVANLPLLTPLFVFAFLYVIATWRILSRAGLPGWGQFIPIYNCLQILKLAGKEWWWIFLLCIPIVNFVIVVIVMIEIARNFGKGTGFGIGLCFLNPIFWLILGLGSSPYQVPP
ncbi:MAG TPA: DUF5684 domain-containing protein, partial [bacterium]|nr:DUF5684 domain-containing protein [bacterium]